VSGAFARLAIAASVLFFTAHKGVSHPLDPLSPGEIKTAVGVLRDAKLTNADTLYPLIDLAEPSKAEVLAWHPGTPAERAAFVVARQNHTAYEGVIDLHTNTVTRWQAIPGIQPGIVPEEWRAAQRITKADPDWREAMRKRGYTDFEKLFCAPLTVGPITDPQEAKRRLLKVVCFDTTGTRINIWGRPIEGLHAVVDLDAGKDGKVIKLVDTGIVPVVRGTGDFAGCARFPARSAGQRAPSRSAAASAHPRCRRASGGRCLRERSRSIARRRRSGARSYSVNLTIPASREPWWSSLQCQ
jgi:primary-amine oxidase